MKHTIISVVIPVYNTLLYLHACMESIEKQNVDAQIVFVDDGSTDGSAAWCDAYAADHDEVIVIHQKNSGASDARNAGINAAHGEYIHFVDSDDMLGCEDAYAFFIENIYPKKPDIIFSRCEEYTKDMQTVLKTQPPYLKSGFDEGDILYDVLYNRYESTLTCPVNKIFSREFLLSNKLYFFSGIQHEEDEWLPRVVQSATTVYYDNHVLYKARRFRENALSNTPDESVLTKKAVSKVKIAALGYDYMKSRDLQKKTMSCITEYYWDYLTDACAECAQLKGKKNKQKVYNELKKNRVFFGSSRYLISKNRKILAVMFRTLGIPLTVRIIGKRYGK